MLPTVCWSPSREPRCGRFWTGLPGLCGSQARFHPPLPVQACGWWGRGRPVALGPTPTPELGTGSCPRHLLLGLEQAGWCPVFAPLGGRRWGRLQAGQEHVPACDTGVPFLLKTFSGHCVEISPECFANGRCSQVSRGANPGSGLLSDQHPMALRPAPLLGPGHWLLGGAARGHVQAAPPPPRPQDPPPQLRELRAARVSGSQDICLLRPLFFEQEDLRLYMRLRLDFPVCVTLAVNAGLWTSERPESEQVALGRRSVLSAYDVLKRE